MRDVALATGLATPCWFPSSVPGLQFQRALHGAIGPVDKIIVNATRFPPRPNQRPAFRGREAHDTEALPEAKGRVEGNAEDEAEDKTEGEANGKTEGNAEGKPAGKAEGQAESEAKMRRRTEQT